jgi:hypothetical protein
VRLSAPIAREVDRLARGAHRRTAWAHHPLCERYGPETLRLGRHVVCKGCALVVLGAAVGFGAALCLRLRAEHAALACAILAAPSILALVRRVPKVVSRALPGGALGLGLGAAVAAPGAATILLGVGLVAALLVHRAVYRRRGPDRSPCATCPERASAPACAGFTPLLRRERAFRRAATRVMDRP